MGTGRYFLHPCTSFYARMRVGYKTQQDETVWNIRWQIPFLLVSCKACGTAKV